MSNDKAVSAISGHAMPITPRHKQQKSKNFTLMAVLIGIVVVLFALTILKNSGIL